MEKPVNKYDNDDICQQLANYKLTNGQLFSSQ